MFAVLLVLALSGSAAGAIGSAAAPSWVSPTLDAPVYRPGMGQQDLL